MELRIARPYDMQNPDGYDYSLRICSELENDHRISELLGRCLDLCRYGWYTAPDKGCSSVAEALLVHVRRW